LQVFIFESCRGHNLVVVDLLTNASLRSRTELLYPVDSLMENSNEFSTTCWHTGRLFANRAHNTMDNLKKF